MTKAIRALWLILVTAVLAAGALAGYRVVRAEIAADIYRARLAELVADYESLRETYNRAVSRTAVTELVVADGRLAVRVRSAAGVLREIPTPFDPAGEVYVDYVVQNGRLWIRRVFDADTAPADAVVLDPEVDDPDWDAPGARFGKAVYRSLGPGRWVVTVTGDGSLGLARARDSSAVQLPPPPQIRDFEQIATEADQRADQIAAADVWRRLFHGG